MPSMRLNLFCFIYFAIFLFSPTSYTAENDRDLLGKMQLELIARFPMAQHARLNRVLFSQISDLLYPGNSQTELLLTAPVRATFVMKGSPQVVQAIMEPLSQISQQPYKVYKIEDLLKASDKAAVELLKELSELMVKKSRDARLHIALDISETTAETHQFFADFYALLAKEKWPFNPKEMAFIIFAPVPTSVAESLSSRTRTDELAQVLVSEGYSPELVKFMANIVYVDKSCAEFLMKTKP